jgi:hypothetical protein
MPFYNQTVLNASPDVRLGIRVDRAPALVANATVALFNVVGGRVEMTQFVGTIAVDIAAAPATTLQITHLTTDVTAVVTVLCIAGGDIVTFAAPRMFALPGTAAGALTASTGAGASETGLCPSYALKTGALQLVGTGAPATGTIGWQLWYFPIDEGAYVEAA